MKSQTGINSIKKVVAIGPECTGKSELSEFLANRFNTRWVAEYAREYLDNLNRPYAEDDLLAIAKGQLQREKEEMSMARKVLICDTNLLVVKIWSRYKYGRCQDEILRLIHPHSYDLYLLTYIDIPWQEDPLREHPHQREALWRLYQEELEQQQLNWVLIKGSREDRRNTAVQAIQTLLDHSK